MNKDELTASLFEGLATVPDFAAAIGRNERTVRRMFAHGLPSVRVGRLTLIPIDGAKAFLRGEASKPKRGRPRKAAA